MLPSAATALRILNWAIIIGNQGSHADQSPTQVLDADFYRNKLVQTRDNAVLVTVYQQVAGRKL
jgi:hypothetical protein